MGPKKRLSCGEVSSTDNWNLEISSKLTIDQIPVKIESNLNDNDDKKQNQNGTEALIENNLWISKVYAKKYAQKYVTNRNMTLSVEDLEQEGYIGLIIAAEHFDDSKGCSFSSYADFWVEKYIRRAIEDTGNIIRKPASHFNRARKVHKFSSEMPLSEVAAATGLDEAEIVFIRNIDNTEYVSFSDKTGNSEDGLCWEDIVPDDTDIAELCEESDCIEKIQKFVTSIEDESCRKVMMWYLGYTENNIAYTCPQIAKMTGQTNYKIRKTVDETFKSIRHFLRS